MKQIAVTENHLYSKAYSRGKKAAAHNVIVYVLKDTHAWLLKKQNPLKRTVNRVGLTVTKKNGGAVVRNRIKRILREAYRQIDDNFHVKRGNIIILAARESAADKKMQDIYSDLLYAFRRLDMLADIRQKNSSNDGEKNE